jgi:hypothetical protein
MLNEIDIEYEPFKKIGIMEYVRFTTPDDLVRFLNVAAGGRPIGAYWTKGVLFFFYPMPVTTEIAAKALLEDKKIYWSFVGYALMPEYRAIIETKEKIIVPVLDMSSSLVFQIAVQWLKERK